MKVISHDAAMATIVFVADEVKPLKGFHLPELLHSVGQRYQAAKVPTLDDARNTAAKFENAVLEVGDRQIAIPTFALHNDGITVTTSVTDDSELVLNDIVEWLRSEFGFRHPITPPAFYYQSDLVVKFDGEIEKAIVPLNAFLTFIQGQMTRLNAAEQKQVQFGGMYFGTDQGSEFSIARRINVPWRLGLYFSKAHMKTSAHIEALEMLDRMIG